MKIVFLIRSMTFGGAERQLIALARGLRDRGHEVHVCVFYAGGPMEAEFRATGLPLTVLGKRGRWDIVGFLGRLARFRRHERPDVLHGYLGMSNSLGVLLRPLHGARVVWGVRASDLDGHRDHWIYRLDAKIELLLSRFPDLIMTNSRAGRDHIVKLGFPAAKAIVIPNGIDSDRFRPDDRQRAAVRAELGVAGDELLVGRARRVDPQKDFPTFLRATAIVAPQRPTARFVCVGPGLDDYVRGLKALGEELGLGQRLIWLGARTDMPAVYNALDVMVSSSAYGEGTPNVVAEAMACGVPCVATDSGDSAWVVGDTGVVVSRGDVDAMAAAMIDLLDAVSQGAIDRGAVRQRIITNLSVDRLVDQTESALCRVVQERSAAWA